MDDNKINNSLSRLDCNININELYFKEELDTYGTLMFPLNHTYRLRVIAPFIFLLE